MAPDAAAAAAPETITVINRSNRFYEISREPGKDPVRLLPGKMIELPAALAKRLLGYKDLADVSKLVSSPSKDAKIKALEEENARLKANQKTELPVPGTTPELPPPAVPEAPAPAPEADDSEATDGQNEKVEKGSAVLLPSGQIGDVTKIDAKKGTASVKLRSNGAFANVALKNLKLAPKE